MPTTTICYDGEDIPLTFPDEAEVSILAPADAFSMMHRGSPDPVAIVREAIASPAGFESLRRFLDGGRRVLVIVNDATRPTPSAHMLAAMAEDLSGQDLRILVATGAHREPSEDEYRQILGSMYDTFRPRCESHRARDDSSLVHVGTTSRGNRITLNRALREVDRIVVTGSVEPHYFAGYTGGRKAFLPGVAGFACIEANHRLALSDAACACDILHNPVSLEMDEVPPMVGVPVFSVMAVLDRHQSIDSCHAGDIAASFVRAARRADEVFTVPMSEKADIVLAVARYPMDIDLSQSQKAIENGALALADGGILILASACREGVGDATFLDLMRAAGSPERTIESVSGSYRLGYHKAAKLARLSLRASVWAVTGIDDSCIRDAFMESKPSIQTAIDEAFARLGTGARIAVLPDGTVTIPRIPVIAARTAVRHLPALRFST